MTCNNEFTVAENALLETEHQRKLSSWANSESATADDEESKDPEDASVTMLPENSSTMKPGLLSLIDVIALLGENSWFG